MEYPPAIQSCFLPVARFGLRYNIHLKNNPIARAKGTAINKANKEVKRGTHQEGYAAKYIRYRSPRSLVYKKFPSQCFDGWQRVVEERTKNAEQDKDKRKGYKRQ